MPIFINDTAVSALVDSGNTAGNCISLSFARKLGLKDDDIESIKDRIGTAKKGESLQVVGKTKQRMKIRFGGLNFSYKTRPFVIKHLTSNVNISLPFLEKHKIDQIHSTKCLKVKGKSVKMHSYKTEFGVNEIKQRSL